jgi:hypothetical protein
MLGIDADCTQRLLLLPFLHIHEGPELPNFTISITRQRPFTPFELFDFASPHNTFLLLLIMTRECMYKYHSYRGAERLCNAMSESVDTVNTPCTRPTDFLAMTDSRFSDVICVTSIVMFLRE